ncbi:MAG: metallophosphoesterase, partial [Lachnospiraceae bacterium]|nr:metallophosphoesterase [Lachnospiraceae bacterium]
GERVKTKYLDWMTQKTLKHLKDVRKYSPVKSNMDFILLSGDIVNFANCYNDWKEWNQCRAFGEYAIAPVAGNKEFYKLIDESSQQKMRNYSPEWFLDNVNIPENGPGGVDSTYWFIYNNVLFISLCNCQEYSPNNKIPVNNEYVLSSQKKWFKDVVTGAKGKYDYIVVQTHYPYFSNEVEGGCICTWGSYEEWRDIFDEFKVDFALCGDYHEYLRSFPLEGDKAVKSGGTIYVTFPLIPYEPWELAVLEGNDKRVAKRSFRGAMGFGIFKVTEEKMVFSLLNFDGEVADEVEVVKKDRT